MAIHEDFKELSDKAVLVVDDEDVVVDVIQEAISPLTSTVEAAFNGVEALAKIMEKDYDFILLDIEMPKMNGMDLFKYICDIKPHLRSRIIFITGDVETESTRTFINQSGCRFIDKPFMLRELFSLMTCLQANP